MIKAGAYFLKTTLTNIPSGTYSFYGNLEIGGMTVGGASDLGRVRCSTDMVEVSQTSDTSQIISAFAILYSGGWEQPTYKSWVFSADYDTSTNGYNMNFELWFVENIASSLVLEVTDVDGMKLLTKDRSVYHDIVVTPKLEKQTFTPDKNGKTITPTTGYCGLGEVAVAPIPDSYVVPEGNVNITENGVVNVKGFETATVDVETTVVEEVLGYEKSVSGDTVDFELMNELPEATSVKGIRGFIVATMDSIEESYVTKIECYYDGVLVKESENNSSGIFFHAVPLNFDVDTIKVTFSRISDSDLTLKVLTGYGILEDVQSATTMSVSNNVVTITNVEDADTMLLGWNLVLCSSYIG